MPFLNSGCWAEASREPIAIIGFALKFPQDANNTEGFWKMLIESRCASTDIPQDRMNSNAFHEKEDGGGESHNTVCLENPLLLKLCVYEVKLNQLQTSSSIGEVIFYKKILPDSMLLSFQFRQQRQHQWILSSGHSWKQLIMH